MGQADLEGAARWRGQDVTASMSAQEFMLASPAPLNGSSAWAARCATELRRVIDEDAAHAPRSLQAHLGPSELGAMCDRQVAGKLAGVARTNHVFSSFPSWRGTNMHAGAERAFSADNVRHGLRWVTEQKVTPHPEHPGTADLYDAVEQAVIDHKFLGPTSMSKIRKSPPRHYIVQLLLYARGYRLLGLPVRRVALAAYPVTAGSLDGLYVWDREYTPADDVLLEEVFAQTALRKQWAAAIITGTANLMDVPAAPDDGVCIFCPFYRPQAAHDGGLGCPGHVEKVS